MTIIISKIQLNSLLIAHFLNHMTNIFRFLEEKKIAYAVIKGVYDEDSLKKEDDRFRKDLDIVMDCNKEDIFPFLKKESNFKYLEHNSFLAISDNLRIDFFSRILFNLLYYFIISF